MSQGGERRARAANQAERLCAAGPCGSDTFAVGRRQMWPQSKHVYTGTMLPVNGSRSVSVDWHLGHGGMVSADSGNLGTLIWQLTGEV